MRYFIAGGGEYGSMYVSKLEKAHTKNKILVDEIIVLDKDMNCKAARTLPSVPPSRVDTTAWERFGEYAWNHREELENDVWVPAPIAPHIIAGWILERLETHFEMTVVPINLPGNVLPLIPYAHTLSDGRILLSHAVGICPVGCTEPGDCALTKGPRWWEMKDTISDLVRGIRPNIDVETVGYFFVSITVMPTDMKWAGFLCKPYSKKPIVFFKWPQRGAEFLGLQPSRLVTAC